MGKGKRENNEKNNIIKLLIILAIVIVIGIVMYLFINHNKSSKSNKEITRKISVENNQEQKLRKMEDVLKDFGGEVIETPKADTAYVKKDDKTYTVYQDGEIVEGEIKLWNGENTEPARDEAGNINIYTAGELKWIAEQVISGKDNFNGTTITLRSNIDLGARKIENDNWEGTVWQSIIGIETENNDEKEFDNSNKDNNDENEEQVVEDEKIEKQIERIRGFSGIFNGNGYKIRGLYINSNDKYQGLFGYSKGTIQNLNIKSSYIKGSTGIGAIVGLNSGNILDCKVEDTIIQSNEEKIGGIAGITTKGTIIQNCLNDSYIYGARYTGGIVGYSNNNVMIKNCRNTGKVNGTGYIGGIVGIIFYGSTIQDCSNTGNIEGEENVAGGLVGYGVGQIENCCNTGNITSASYIGGIIGINFNMGNVIKCYNNGGIDGDNNIGGIVGINKGSISSCYNNGNIVGIGYRAGGICGQNSADSNIYSCYNTGKVETETNPGGITGGDFGTVTNCYYLNTILKENNEQSKSEEELKLINTELGDDFSQDLSNINNGYPILSWQSQEIK